MTTIAPRLADLDLGLPASVPFTAAQARSCGVSDMRLHRLVRAGVLRRLLTGVYIASEVPDCIEARCAALALVIPPDAFVCDRTAAWLHTGSGAVGPNEHLAVPPLSCFRPRRHGIVEGTDIRSGQRTLLDRDLTEVNGLAVTTPLRTALDLGRLERTVDMRLWSMDNRRWLRDSERWHLEVLRRANVFGRLQDADTRLRRAAQEARASLGRRLYFV